MDNQSSSRALSLAPSSRSNPTLPLQGVLVIGLSETCHICKNLEAKGLIEDLLDLEGTFVKRVLTVRVSGLPPPGTPAILIVDTKYPNFKYFKNEEVFERAKTSGPDWYEFIDEVKFFNRKVVGGQLEVTQDYQGAWSMQVFKKFCIDSDNALNGSVGTNSKRRAIIKARYTK